MLTRRLAIAALSLTLLSVHAAMTQELITETHRKADVGTPFEIALMANPSTGYQWQVQEASSTGLQLVTIEDLGTASSASTADRPIVGAPTMHTWRITPRQPGSVRLVLNYSRPWETGPAAKTHVFLIDIAGGGSRP
jgi:predicted secreted protein